MDLILIDGASLDLDSVVRVARRGGHAGLSQEAVARMETSRAVVNACVARNLVRYGITTGFGKFCDIVVSAEQLSILQENLLKSHACGTGDPFAGEIVRAMMLLRANALAVGNSGIRPSTVRALVAMLNAGIEPEIPEKGSLGASGDLAPLAHMALVLTGSGHARVNGRRMGGGEALGSAGIVPVRLEAKEGLALINGTQAMTAVGALACSDALSIVRLADLAAALSIQALGGIVDAFDPRIHALRGQPGQIECARRMRALLHGSGFTTRQGQERVQDAYALRCVPQVHGASADAVLYAATAVGRELNAVTDNPLIFPMDEDGGEEGGEILSGGNFHGQPVALPMDFLAIACAEYASISERRLERLVNPALSNGLPAFLSPEGGLNSGFMIMQYSAASLVSENKVYAHPASVDSIPSSANQEDHVSMGTIAARKARSIVGNVQTVLAMEVLAACQAIDLRLASHGRRGQAASRLSPATKDAYRLVRSVSAELGEDRILYTEIEAVRKLILDGSLEATIPPLEIPPGNGGG